MMRSPKFVFCLICLFVGKMAHMTDQKVSSSIHQKRRLVSANVGENVTLQCFYESDDSAWLYWYKQTLGQKPRLMSTFYVYETKATFYHEFNNPRFTLDTKNSTNHLTIFDLDISDSATYYCGARYTYTFVLTFAEGTTVNIKSSGLKVPALVHQSASEPIQPGGSVTLNCTVHTGTCDGEHSVYWFKNSEESHPGLIYTHGGRNDQCERNSSTQTHTCVYNLPLESLNPSHAGTYYCAVASCGHILFGNGTKLDFEDQVDSLVLVYFLSGALIFTTILIVLLVILVYKIIKKNNCQCTESQARLSTPATTTAEGYQDADSLHYAALNVNLPNRSRRQRNNTNSECVYSSVKQMN
ncbi:immunoglobulin kappa light chain-like [Micropterus dolomieu]|uniref:immunoglobulin kappa light chain-like n=1 Tax=Micropterus dolomieu TaxID=147949 RepID=UPI001E8CED9E|nr:immunoglobulin kappa light chain-like [Micropterus dolomieu]